MLLTLSPRVDWGLQHIASVCDGRVRLHDSSGAVVRELAFDSLAISAAWLADGTLVVLDHGWTIRCLAPGGELVVRADVAPDLRPSPSPLAIDVAPAGECFVACGLGRAVVFTLDGKLVWRFDPDAHDAHRSGAIGARLTREGRTIVVAHATRATGDRRPPGRGFLLIDLDDLDPAHPAAGPRRVFARSWLQTPAQPDSAHFAFSADGTRMIQASSDPGPHVGAIRIGKTRRAETYDANQPGGAHALAFDPIGVIAAYAYREQPRRFRVDYLDPEPTGGAMIDVLDTLWIDPSVPDVAALAISPDSRSIACLARDGTLEIIVVP